jgi:ribosome maturation factor RimP
MIKKEKVLELVDQHLAGTPYFPVEVVVKPGNRIMVFIDGDHGVTIDICREISQHLNKVMDRDQEDYDLTVSSAGIDQPLKLPRQYAKNKGKQLDLITADGEKFTGLIVEVNDHGITLEKAAEKKQKQVQEKTVITLTYGEIKSAREIIIFKH